MYTVTLADGTQLKNLERNGDNYIAAGLIENSVFKNNLSTVTISDGETIKISEDMVLVQNTTIFGDGKKSWFILAEKSPQEKEKEALEAEIMVLRTTLAEVGDVVDNLLIEQLTERGIILHE